MVFPQFLAPSWDLGLETSSADASKHCGCNEFLLVERKAQRRPGSRRKDRFSVFRECHVREVPWARGETKQGLSPRSRAPRGNRIPSKGNDLGKRLRTQASIILRQKCKNFERMETRKRPCFLHSVYVQPRIRVEPTPPYYPPELLASASRHRG